MNRLLAAALQETVQYGVLGRGEERRVGRGRGEGQGSGRGENKWKKGVKRTLDHAQRSKTTSFKTSDISPDVKKSETKLG